MAVPRSTKERIWGSALLYGMIHAGINDLRDGVENLARTMSRLGSVVVFSMLVR